MTPFSYTHGYVPRQRGLGPTTPEPATPPKFPAGYDNLRWAWHSYCGCYIVLHEDICYTFRRDHDGVWWLQVGRGPSHPIPQENIQ